eukprot:7865243-Alexandrium_andersonii.AAC.1
MAAAARGSNGHIPEAVRAWLAAHELDVPVSPVEWGRCLAAWRGEQLLQRRLHLSPAALGPTAARQRMAAHWVLGRRLFRPTTQVTGVRRPNGRMVTDADEMQE